MGLYMSSAAAATDFRHERLPDRTWIRLIKIHPHLQDDCISCSLDHFDQDTASDFKYVALSYMWGDPTPRHAIYINGRRRLIHTSLWEFFNRMWLRKTDQWFWTDSLCLDQACHRELNEQVARMGDIYSQADHVMSWLGESEAGVKALEAMVEFGDEQDEVFGTLASEAPRIHAGWNYLTIHEEYWGRVWVFQEIACAKRSSVVCGPVEVDFEELLRQMRKATRKLKYVSWQDDEYEKTWMFKLAYLRESILERKSLSFVDLLRSLSQCDSTRQADRIYGLLGLAERLVPGFHPQLLDINYNKTLHDIMWDIIFWRIESTASDTAKEFATAMRDVCDIMAVGQYGMPPPYHHQWFWTTPASRKRQVQAACKAYWSVQLVFDERRLPEELYRAIRGAADHICATYEGARRTDAGVGALLGLCLIVTHPRALDPKIGFAVAAARPTLRGAYSWSCTAHLPDQARAALDRAAAMGSDRVSRKDRWAGFHDKVWGPLPRCSARWCSESAAVLEISDLGLLFRVKIHKTDEHSHVLVAVEWICMSCAMSQTETGLAT